MIKRKPDGSLPTLMTRAEVAEYLGLTEKQVIAQQHKPGFPKHSATWRHWFYVGKDVEAWKMKCEQPQLEIEDAINAKRIYVNEGDLEQIRELAARLLAVSNGPVKVAAHA